MSKSIKFRNELLYLRHYSEIDDKPGIIQICVAFVWEVIWIDNLYYGTDPILEQSEDVPRDPLVFSDHTITDD